MASLPAPCNWVCLWRHLRRRWNTKRLGGHKPSRHVARHVALIIPSSPRAACSTPLRATLFFCAAAHDSFPHRMAVVVRGPSAFLTHMIRGCRGVPSIPSGSPQTPPRFLRRPGGEGGGRSCENGGIRWGDMQCRERTRQRSTFIFFVPLRGGLLRSTHESIA